MIVKSQEDKKFCSLSDFSETPIRKSVVCSSISLLGPCDTVNSKYSENIFDPVGQSAKT